MEQLLLPILRKHRNIADPCCHSGEQEGAELIEPEVAPVGTPELLVHIFLSTLVALLLVNLLNEAYEMLTYLPNVLLGPRHDLDIVAFPESEALDGGDLFVNGDQEDLLNVLEDAVLEVREPFAALLIEDVFGVRTESLDVGVVVLVNTAEEEREPLPSKVGTQPSHHAASSGLEFSFNLVKDTAGHFELDAIVKFNQAEDDIPAELGLHNLPSFIVQSRSSRLGSQSNSP